MSSEDLRSKYGEKAFEAGRRIQGDAFERRVAQRDSLDPHFTKQWLDFAIAGMSERPQLDTRTRLLVLTGQYTMAKSHRLLEETVRAAVAAKVPAPEILEIILQCVVYGGHTTVDPAIEVFHRLATELNLMPEIRKAQLPLDGTDRQRNFEAEKAKWHPQDVADPRFQKMIDAHGWLSVGRGLTLRPKHHLNVLSWLDAMDPHFADLWVKFCYGGMYTRGMVDDKTRLLCMVGDCLAVGESIQAKGHMRGAIRNGAKPREVMEVVLYTCVNFGMPSALHALQAFVGIMAQDGRLAEIGNPPLSVDSYDK